jgi:hypothetical protein
VGDGLGVRSGSTSDAFVGETFIVEGWQAENINVTSRQYNIVFFTIRVLLM